MNSHHDDECAFDQLPWQARLNCDCDQQAALVRDCYTYVQAKKISYKLPLGHSATLEIGNTFITKHLPLAVRNEAYKGDMAK